MSDQFDPAPFDKYAETPDEAFRTNNDADKNLKAGLIGTFPASDPVSVSQPASTTSDDHRSLWDKVVSVFKH